MRPAALALSAAGMLLASGAHAGDALELRERGVQLYACAAAGGDFVWNHRSSEATLLDPLGMDVAHATGFTWQAKDGSMVSGEALVTSSGEPGGVPWVVLRAKTHGGAGLLASVRYIVQSRTIGGTPASGGCDKEHAGTEQRVEYSAISTFFSEQEPPKPD